MKKIVFLFIVILIGINCNKKESKIENSTLTTETAKSYSPEGTWKSDDQLFNVEINIYAGGTYYYSDNLGSHMGKWTQEGNNIKLVSSEDGWTEKCWLMSEQSMGLSNFGVLHKK